MVYVVARSPTSDLDGLIFLYICFSVVRYCLKILKKPSRASLNGWIVLAGKMGMQWCTGQDEASCACGTVMHESSQSSPVWTRQFSSSSAIDGRHTCDPMAAGVSVLLASYL
jgi:hypothetical protein